MIIQYRYTIIGIKIIGRIVEIEILYPGIQTGITLSEDEHENRVRTHAYEWPQWCLNLLHIDDPIKDDKHDTINTGHEEDEGQTPKVLVQRYTREVKYNTDDQCYERYSSPMFDTLNMFRLIYQDPSKIHSKESCYTRCEASQDTFRIIGSKTPIRW